MSDIVNPAQLKPGQRVRIFQEIDRREGDWCNAVEGTVVAVYPQKTGSWNAHGKNDRLWLNRIRIRKDDGEESILSVDQFTRYEPA